MSEAESAAPLAPYYEDEHVTLYLGDSLELLPPITADVLVTDPPYGTQFTSNNPRGGYGRRQLAHSADGFTIANDKDASARDAVLAAWGERPALVFGTPRNPEPPGGWDHRLVWDKVEPGMNGGPWRYTHESIFIRGDGWHRVSASSYSILRFPRSDGMGNAERSEHPHRKPIGLMRTLLEAAPGGVIFDPFAGTGSTLLAARDLGRRAVGVEIEERYCEIAARRFANQTFTFGGVA